MYFEQNLKVITERWPELAEGLKKTPAPEQVEVISDAPERTLKVNGIHLSSCYDRLREARIQAELVPEGSSLTHVYGLATGDLPRVLLQRTKIEKLTVVLMNLAVAKASLTHLDHRDWLSDPRICLSSAVSEKELRVPFACASACLYLADDESARLRDLLQLELATPYIRFTHARKRSKYLARLEENRKFIDQDSVVSELFAGVPGKSIVVAGAGPTLPDQFEWLRKDRDDYILLAVDVAAKPLVDAGLLPDIVVSIDSAENLFEKVFSGLNSAKLFPATLVYFPVIERKILEFWPGKRFVAFSEDDIYQEIGQKALGNKLFSSGSVIHPTVDLAVKLGASRIVLVGADFSFPEDKSHADGAGISLTTEGMKEWVHNGAGERVPTTLNYRGYLRDLERYIAFYPEIEFINSSRKGAKIEGTEYLEEDR